MEDKTFSVTAKDIRVGSFVKAPGIVGGTVYKVVQIGTRLLGDDSFLGRDVSEYPYLLQVLSCSLITEIISY